MAENKNLTIIKEETIDAVTKKIAAYQKGNTLHLPADYSAENALKSAWLTLQNTKNKDGQPVLTTCTNESILNALMDMVIQGLNPAKKQGYFIAYGNQLTFQRSYFGTMAVAKMVNANIGEIVAEVVYEGDTFKYTIERGKKRITQHEQDFGSVDDDKIKGAYCMVIDKDGQIIATDIMTMAEIKQAWLQSQTKPVDEKGEIKASSVHGKFTSAMCKKTVINRTCKPIINSSSDSHLFRQAVNRSTEIAAENGAAEEIAAGANGELLDIEAEIMTDGPSENDAAAAAPAADPDLARKATVTDHPAAKKPQQQTLEPTGTDGPGY